MEPRVATGMNAGVSTSPCGVLRTPNRARDFLDRLSILKENIANASYHDTGFCALLCGTVCAMKTISVRTAVIFVLVIVALGALWRFFDSSSANSQDIVVQSKEFVQEVNVSGKVIAAHDVDLGFAGGGRVSRVYAQVGDRVEAGRVIAEIENGDLRAALDQKEASLAAQDAKLAALKAGTRPESLAVSESSVDAARSTLDQANQAVINAIADAYTQADDAVRVRVDTFIYDPRSTLPQLMFNTREFQNEVAVETRRISTERVLVDWQAHIASLAPGVVDEVPGSSIPVAITEARTALSAVVGLLTAASAALADGFESATFSRTNITSAMADITQARANINAAITALNTAETAQKTAAASYTSAQKSLTLAQAPATQADVDAQTAQVRAAQADVDAARAQLGKTLIVAPFSGVITKLDAKAGLIASGNTPLVSLQSGGTFQIESFIPETSVSLVQVGQPSAVTLDAYGDEPFAATVASIDPAETLRDGVSTYRVVLQFAKPDTRVKSGMSANVTIAIEQRDNVVSIPVGLVHEKEGTSYVTVREGNATVERVVQTGPVSSLGEVEIVAGLAEGDTVVRSTK